MVIGHERIIRFLLKAAKSDNLAHAYIFSGPESIGKMTTALEFSKFLQCSGREVLGESKHFNYCDQCKDCYDIDNKSHPDLLIIEPENEDITIGQIRNLTKSFSLKNYSAPYKIVIIDGAEKMTAEAANALLKTLEEPARSSLLILATSYPDALLDTISSRCQQIKFLPVAYQELENNLLDYYKNDSSVLADIPEAARVSSGIPGAAIKTIHDTAFKERKDEVYGHFFNLAGSSLNFRYQYVNSFLLKNNIDEVLSAWLHLLNNLLHLRFNRAVSSVNINIGEDLKNALANYSLAKILLLIEKIKETKFLLRTTNVNKKLALEVLMLEL